MVWFLIPGFGSVIAVSKGSMPQLNPILKVLIWLAFVSTASAQPAAPYLTNAADVLSAHGERAFGQAVFVRGIVTAAQPDWTGGIFVADKESRKPEPGDVVEVHGTSHPGGFAPFINDATWTKVGTAPLPEPKRVPIERLMAGIEDGERVEVSGIVRAIRKEDAITVIEIA